MVFSSSLLMSVNRLINSAVARLNGLPRVILANACSCFPRKANVNHVHQWQLSYFCQFLLPVLTHVSSESVRR